MNTCKSCDQPLLLSQGLQVNSSSRILVEPLSTTSESEPELQEEPVDLGKYVDFIDDENKK